LTCSLSLPRESTEGGSSSTAHGPNSIRDRHWWHWRPREEEKAEGKRFSPGRCRQKCSQHLRSLHLSIAINKVVDESIMVYVGQLTLYDKTWFDTSNGPTVDTCLCFGPKKRRSFIHRNFRFGLWKVEAKAVRRKAHGDPRRCTPALAYSQSFLLNFSLWKNIIYLLQTPLKRFFPHHIPLQ
jgi:hypothetical protein